MILQISRTPNNNPQLPPISQSQKEKTTEMKKELEIAVIRGNDTQAIDNLCPRHNREGIPYVELRRGGKYGEIWFETPCDIPFNPKPVFDLREWYESYWLKRRGFKGLHPYRFSIGPTAVWFKFILDDLDLVKEQLSKLTWKNTAFDSSNLPKIKESSDKIFWDYEKNYFRKSKSMRREKGQKVDMSGWRRFR
jgi:hypothetical protein